MAPLNVKIREIQRGLKTAPVGSLTDCVGEACILQGVDQTGNICEWIVKPTGPRSFEIVLPEGHDVGSPDSWENISIMTQRVVVRGTAENCGCDGNQCGCQGQNCGSNCNSNAGRLRLRASMITTTHPMAVERPPSMEPKP